MKGPKDGIMRAIIKNKSNDFYRHTCILPISVGSYPEAAKLEAIIDCINDSFSQCIILICDSLQRHNLVLENPEFSEKALLALSEQKGTLWLEKNIDLRNKIADKSTVQRWSDWLNHPDYFSISVKLEQEYHNNEKMRLSFIKTAQTFLDRDQRRDLLSKEQKDLYLDKCIQYLKEESVVALFLFPEAGYHYLAYPGKISEAMQSVVELLVPKSQNSKINWLTIEFKRYASKRVYDLKPLDFSATTL